MEPRREISTVILDSETQKSDSIFLPILMDITHPEITWDEDQTSPSSQQDGHLRLVNDVRGIMYRGDGDRAHYYAPCSFSIKFPKEDGRQKSSATASISCADGRLIEVIRSVGEDLSVQVVAMYAKITAEDGGIRYTFSRLGSRSYSMGDVSYDGLTASWTLDPDAVMDASAPKDKGSLFRFPSMMKKE